MLIRNGTPYTNTGIIFDKIYENKKSMDENANSDSIFPGRYVLIKYCEDTFSPEERQSIENSITNQFTVHSSQYNYWNNWNEDGKKSYDRKIFRKTFNEQNEARYEEIGMFGAMNYIEQIIQEKVEEKVQWYSF